MKTPPDPRGTVSVFPTDLVVVGAGIAGLSAALTAAELGSRVTVLTRGPLGAAGSSVWAQGGVAAAMEGHDSPRLHARDTLAVGGGLNEPGVVRLMAGAATTQIRRLLKLGARFDRGEDGALALGQEGGHSRRRVLHAGGDATGREMVRALVEAVLAHGAISVHEEVLVTELIRERGRVLGVVARRGSPARPVAYRGAAVVLATGGLGQLYLHTTNPPEARGDGLAMAARAGALLADLEFVQFHPTALECALDPLPLLTEALRGEGGLLVNELDQRFMVEEHPAAELAPRDVVARALWHQRRGGHETFLDLRPLGPEIKKRFPTVCSHCRRAGLDPVRERIPVVPAAHYHMGGIAVDEWGRSSLPGLWACGEVASTGAHGANRLASNSLLEGLVFGGRVARDVVAWKARPQGEAWPASFPSPRPVSVPSGPVSRAGRPTRDDASLLELRRLLWQGVGLRRDPRGLVSAARRTEELAVSLPPGTVRNAAQVGHLLARAALERQESRGSHFRTDFPQERPEWRHRLFLAPEPSHAGATGEARREDHRRSLGGGTVA